MERAGVSVSSSCGNVSDVRCGGGGGKGGDGVLGRSGGSSGGGEGGGVKKAPSVDASKVITGVEVAVELELAELLDTELTDVTEFFVEAAADGGLPRDDRDE